VKTVRMKDLKSTIMAVVKSGHSPCLVGPSGCGKTRAVEQLAEELGAELVILNALTIDPASLNFPVVDPVKKSVDWIPASVFMANGKRKVFFADELTHASTMVQSLLYGVTNEKRIGMHPLPADCIVIAAHNRVQDKGVHNRVPDPLVRRWFELYVEPDLQSWRMWANGAGIDPMVVAFLSWREKYLYMDMVNSQPAPDPRAWEFVSDLLKTSPTIDNDMLLTLLEGKVGAAAAIEFLAFRTLFASLPSLDAILAAPAKHAVYTDPATNYAIACGLSKCITVATFQAVTTYLERITGTDGTAEHEYLVLAVKDAIERDKSLESCKGFIQFSVKYQEYLT